MGCGRGDNEVGGQTSNRGCVCEVVRAILEIQNAAVQDECSNCTTNCFLEPLGGIVNPARSSVDTRVFTLLTKDGSPFFAQFSTSDGDCEPCVSIYFRVEDVFDGCCATLRVLVPLDENEDPVDLLNDDGTKISLREVCKVTQFATSESCVTVDLDCFCAVQCIDDVDLGICN
ncbi:spore coat protein CotZ [Lysinibacillus sp. 2017]|uniref:CotY/CotZ family spore coat protein n=1 Tax=unclassified Lysinibacillus TaxID=2636778 RepID=UPI000D526A1C|nr:MULTISPECIES: CotY/CotZ family spore coat protein [unclassified Lysinibacillus]AWE06463.1 spore coat protein CotZ [Lysinibacillus sp. 2017]TGN31191.1 spore coat protein CotZ [Lysinibacillus sp. S2017]